MTLGTLEDARRDMDRGLYDMTCNGKCTGCGSCCSNLLPMTDKEIEIIRKYIKRHRIREQKHLVPFANAVLDMTCPFLDAGKKTERCNIYRVRPAICRWFKCDEPMGISNHINEALKETRFPVNMRKIFYG